MKKIAVVGISCLFPDARNPQEFWQNLLDEKDSSSLTTKEEIGQDPNYYFHPEKGKEDKYYFLRGSYIRDFEFDPSGYALPEDLLANLDHIFQWSLYVTKEALRDSGYLDQPKILEKCGIILGNLSFPTQSSNELFLPIYHQAIEEQVSKVLHTPLSLSQLKHWDAKTALYNSLISGGPASIVSQALGLSSNYFCIDGACASSLYTVKLACDYLLQGKSDLMIAGAVSGADAFFVHMGFSTFQAYPNNQEGRPLDQNSGGLVAGEGAGVFVLKRYEDALRDGDQIYATIQGIGLSNDGRGKFILSPNPKGQMLAFERAYADAKVPFEDIDYIECHATGTPLGDITEINSMESFFGEEAKGIKIGSVKSNFGHLLTTAGMAGMMKVILSMAHEKIPATIRVKNPIVSGQGLISGEQMVREQMDWPQSQSNQKVAAMSAFGFGGTNAHLVFSKSKQEETDKTEETREHEVKPTSIAITGLSAFFGDYQNLDEFENAIYEGKQSFRELPKQRWKGMENSIEILSKYGLPSVPQGAYISEFDMDFLQFKIPPNPNDPLIPQQLLLLNVVDQALRDANLVEGGHVAVLVAMETDLSLHQFRGRIELEWRIERALQQAGIELQEAEKEELHTLVKNSLHLPVAVNQFTSFIGNLMACRVSALWDFSGPAFTISAEANSTTKALEVAQMLLSNNEVSAVVVGAVDLAGSIENILIRSGIDLPQGDGQSSMSFEKQKQGWIVGEGAGAVVLQKTEHLGDSKAYATIQGLGFAKGGTVESIQFAANQALAQGNINAKDVHYLEVNASGFHQEDEIELQGLVEVYESVGIHQCAIGSIKANIGNTFVASGMASLIKTVLCISNGYFPVVPAWEESNEIYLGLTSPFYVPSYSRPWLTTAKERRKAAINVIGMDGMVSHIILEEPELQEKRKNSVLSAQTPFLLPVIGESITEIQQSLQDLRTQVDQGINLSEIAYQSYQKSEHSPIIPFRAVLLARERKEVLQEIELASQGIPNAIENEGEWSSPAGSYFSAVPLATKGKVAFVYPGGFNSYVGMVRDIFRLFPQLEELSERYTKHLPSLLAELLLYPRTITKPSEQEVIDQQKNFSNEPIAMFESGITTAVLYTTILQEYFKIEPQMVFGYSMGELSMMYSTGAWQSADRMSDILHTGSTFTTRLAGAMNTVRQAWKINEPEQGGANDIWATHTILASVQEVEKALVDEEKVFLIIINTSTEVVIAGDPEACQRVIQKVGKKAFHTPVNDVIHNELVKADYDDLFQLHHLPIENVPEIDYYSAVNYEITEVHDQQIADNIARLYAQQIDFPKLVEKVYANGARVFIELGPRKTCSTWIEQILEEQKHIAVAINQKGSRDYLSIIRMLAKLYAHQVPMDLSLIYPKKDHTIEKKHTVVSSILLGGTRIEQTIRTLPTLKKEKEPQRELLPKLILSKTEEEPSVVPNVLPSTDSQEQMYAHAHQVNQSHHLFLQMRHFSLQQFVILLQQSSGTKVDPLHSSFDSSLTTNHHSHVHLHTPEENRSLNDLETSHAFPQEWNVPEKIIWNETDLLEFAEGKIGNVFGNEYEVIDSYTRRVRLPMPPYLLVSRVTELHATKGEFKPSTITTEYDIPYAALYSTDGQISWAVAVESGQCDLMLISYLGIDFAAKGNQVYRLLDCTITFFENFARAGQTLRYEIYIDSFAEHNHNLLFFFHYDCFVGERLVHKMEGGCAGFFSDEDLAKGKGIIYTSKELDAKAKIQKQHFTPLLACSKTSFSKTEVSSLVEGNLVQCFGYHYEASAKVNPSLHFPSIEFLMFDEVVSIEHTGGAWGLGQLVAQKHLQPNDWYFPCHFKGDEVLAGSLMGEGCFQLLEFYTLYLGLQTQTQNARFQPTLEEPQKIRCRGQVLPSDRLMVFRMEITEIGLEPEPYAKANVEVILGEKMIADIQNIGIRLVENSYEVLRDDRQQSQLSTPLQTPEKTVLINEELINEFSTGDIVKCMGEEFAIYAERRPPRNPNGELQFISRILSFEGERHQFKQPVHLIAEYDVPADVWFYRDNAYPYFPYSVIMEIALQPCGFVTAYAGSTLLFPDIDLFFRNLDGQGVYSRDVDLRGKTVTGHASLLTTSAISNTIIQTFMFELFDEQGSFYKGTTTFGYFTIDALTNQVGLDRGERILPWYQQEEIPSKQGLWIDLAQPEYQSYYHASSQAPHFRLSGHYLDLIREAFLVEHGGKYQQGYIYAQKLVDRNDWFYPYHFYKDPVMPGSLGVEAILQTMQLFALQQNMGSSLSSPRFAQALHHETIWKYRGQIVPDNQIMYLEVHIKEIRQEEHQMLIIADASLWKDQIRIYEITNVALAIEES